MTIEQFRRVLLPPPSYHDDSRFKIKMSSLHVQGSVRVSILNFGPDGSTILPRESETEEDGRGPTGDLRYYTEVDE